MVLFLLPDGNSLDGSALANSVQMDLLYLQYGDLIHFIGGLLYCAPLFVIPVDVWLVTLLRKPWRKGEVERSHLNDQRHFYDWEKFANVCELNQKLESHLSWGNTKAMRTLGWKNPLQLLADFLGSDRKSVV